MKGDNVIWTHRCRGCPHIQSEHTVAEGGEIPDGPWRCLRCDCVVSRDDVIGYAMNKLEFEEYVAEFGTRDELIASLHGDPS